MKRIDIRYGGDIYSIGGRDLQEVVDEIARGIVDGPSWLLVNDGEGARRDAYLLLTPGTPLVVVPVPTSEDHSADIIDLKGHGDDDHPISNV